VISIAEDETGLIGITLEMDEQRMIRWDVEALQTFEQRARKILKEHEIGQPRMPLHTGFIIANYIKVFDILLAAVQAAIHTKEEKTARAAIQGYLDKGGSLEVLEREIYHAYLVTNDPSSVSIWKENVLREDQNRKLERERQDLDTRIKMAELEISRQKLAELTLKVSGVKPPG
jgi:hypothetical protein